MSGVSTILLAASERLAQAPKVPNLDLLATLQSAEAAKTSAQAAREALVAYRDQAHAAWAGAFWTAAGALANFLVVAASLGLAGLTFLRSKQLKLETDYVFTSPPHGHSTATLFNTGREPIIVRYWDVAWRLDRPHWFARRDFDVLVAKPDLLDSSRRFTVRPFEHHTVRIDEEQGTFDWMDPKKPKGKLYFRLVLARGGPKRCNILIWDPKRDP